MWTFPCSGRVTSPFGPRKLAAGMFPFHYGVDLGAGRGPVYAARDGIVRSIFITSKGGWVVDIRHPDEGGHQIRTRYIHMFRHEIRVKVGQKVDAGQQIGNSGESGSPGSPHLHFEVMVDGVLVDPVPFLRDRGVHLGATPVVNPLPTPTPPPSVSPPASRPIPPAPAQEDDEPMYERLLMIYVNRLGREPDPLGAAAWCAAVARGDLTWEQVDERIASDPESLAFAALGSETARDRLRAEALARVGWPAL